jgi:tetratricopeptide (TPR) repeat protein
VRLIQARDGFQLWSDTFDRQMDDIFMVQEEIAHRVTDSLRLTLLGKKTPPAAKSINPEAYKAYLQGRYFLSRGNEDNLLKSARYFEEATRLDPGYAPAWVGLSDAYNSQATWGYLSAEEGYRKARETVQRALALDPDLGAAHASMSRLQIFHDWDWDGADRSCRRALELEPGNADAIVGAGLMALTLGHPDEAFARYHEAMEIDPLAPIRHHEVGLALHYAGRQQEAAAALKKSLELAPDLENSHCLLSRVYLAQSRPRDALAEAEKETHPIFRACGLALAYYALGRKKESDANLAELLNKYQAEALYQIADVYAFRGEKDRALDFLERAYAARDSGLTEVKVDPLLQGLRHDSRYTALLVKMHLPL